MQENLTRKIEDQMNSKKTMWMSGLAIAAGSALAIVSNYEKGENVDSSGKTFSVSIRATTMFRSEGGKWKMIGHHTNFCRGWGSEGRSLWQEDEGGGDL